MRKVLLMNIFGLSLLASSAASGQIKVKSEPEELKFKQVYTTYVHPRGVAIKIVVTCRNYSPTDRMYSGEMDQPDGKWILFDPQAPADKIIDPVLLPMVNDVLKEILAQDKAFVRSNPSEITDESGRRWKRE